MINPLLQAAIEPTDNIVQTHIGGFPIITAVILDKANYLSIARYAMESSDSMADQASNLANFTLIAYRKTSN